MKLFHDLWDFDAATRGVMVRLSAPLPECYKPHRFALKCIKYGSIPKANCVNTPFKDKEIEEHEVNQNEWIRGPELLHGGPRTIAWAPRTIRGAPNYCMGAPNY